MKSSYKRIVGSQERKATEPDRKTMGRPLSTLQGGLEAMQGCIERVEMAMSLCIISKESFMEKWRRDRTGLFGSLKGRRH